MGLKVKALTFVILWASFNNERLLVCRFRGNPCVFWAIIIMVPDLFLRSKMWDLCAQMQHDSDRNAVPELTKPEDTLDRSTDVQLWSHDNSILRNTEIERENANGKGCYKIWNKINGITWVCKKWNVVLKMNHKQNVSSKSDDLSKPAMLKSSHLRNRENKSSVEQNCKEYSKTMNSKQWKKAICMILGWMRAELESESKWLSATKWNRLETTGYIRNFSPLVFINFFLVRGRTEQSANKDFAIFRSHGNTICKVRYLWYKEESG